MIAAAISHWCNNGEIAVIRFLEKQFELADNCGLANCALTHGQTANVAKSMPATQCVGVQLVPFI